MKSPLDTKLGYVLFKNIFTRKRVSSRPQDILTKQMGGEKHTARGINKSVVGACFEWKGLVSVGDGFSLISTM